MGHMISHIAAWMDPLGGERIDHAEASRDIKFFIPKKRFEPADGSECDSPVTVVFSAAEQNIKG